MQFLVLVSVSRPKPRDSFDVCGGIARVIHEVRVDDVKRVIGRVSVQRNRMTKTFPEIRGKALWK